MRALSQPTGRAVVVKINLGTQAQYHSQLRAGLYVKEIGPTDVSTMNYEEVLQLLRTSKKRPLTISFVTVRPPSYGNHGAMLYFVGVQLAFVKTFVRQGRLGTHTKKET